MGDLLSQWIGKNAIVTGASSGIGAAISETLVKNGINVIGLARNSNPINAMAQKYKEEEKSQCQKFGKMCGFDCDVTDECQVKETFKTIEDRVGSVSILINNAGVLFNCNLLDGTIDEFNQTLKLNVLAKCITTKTIIDQMTRNNIEGQIININSVLGHSVYDLPNMNVYPASQFAITALTETFRLELLRQKSNIKISNLSPGPVDTNMFDPSKPLKGQITHFLKPSDVADAVLYILSTPKHVQVQDLIIRPVGELH